MNPKKDFEAVRSSFYRTETHERWKHTRDGNTREMETHERWKHTRDGNTQEMETHERWKHMRDGNT
jgi:hypothetical protein